MIRMMTMVAVCLAITGCSTTERRFLSAVCDGEVDSVKAMCMADATLVSAEDERHATGLNLAVERSNVEMVRVLINAGSDLYHDAELTGMPLHDAACFGNKEIVELLLTAGADVNRQPKRKSSHSNGTPLHTAVGAEKSDIVRILLAHGADVNAHNFREGVTPLHVAAAGDPSSREMMEILHLLLDHDADVNAKCDDGRTPLSCAKRRVGAEKGNRQVVDFLLEHGAKDSVSEPATKASAKESPPLMPPNQVAKRVGQPDDHKIQLVVVRNSGKADIVRYEVSATLAPWKVPIKGMLPSGEMGTEDLPTGPLPEKAHVYWREKGGQEHEIDVNVRDVISRDFKGDLVFEIMLDKSVKVFADSDYGYMKLRDHEVSPRK